MLFTFTGCNYIEEYSAPHIKTHQFPEENRINTVAILPLINQSEKEGVGDILRKSFFRNFDLKGYDLVRLEQIDERLQLASIDTSNILKKNIYTLGRIVNADALIYGTVLNCDKHFFGVYSRVTLRAEIQMIDAHSSAVIWAAIHTEKSHSDSIPTSPLGLPIAVIESSINIRDKVIEDTANRLAKKFTSHIPAKDFVSTLHADVIHIKPNGNSMGVFYRVQKGDTLFHISRKFYDSIQKVDRIRERNNGLSADNLKAGQELIIPDVPILNNINESQDVDKDQFKKAVYRIKWGDNLYDIASSLFHNGKKWHAIYRENKDELNDPKDLPVGQVIIIPLRPSL